MKSKLVFRILGALSSALIIASVFVPFVSVTGYTTSLWESFEATNSLYLPIMIIVFGAIGVIFFALNIKTEFAYMSAGAISFFAIMQTIDVLNQGVFDTLSVGYYFLVAGALLTGIMAFLTNLKTRKNEENIAPITQTTELSMLDQIDKLYSDQTTIQNEITPIQPINNMVEPIPVQPIETVTPIQPIETVTPIQTEQSIPVTPIQPEVTQIQVESQPIIEQPVQNMQVPNMDQSVNPVVQEFTNPQPVVNPAPEVQPMSQSMIEQPVQNLETSNIEQPVNPVVQEFMHPGSAITPNSSSNTQEVDIFGQPINK